MKKSFILFLIFFPAILAAQNHYLGVKGGVNFSNVDFSSEPVIEDWKYRTGMLAGITYDYYFLEFLSCGAEISYIQKGYFLDVLFTNEIGEPIGEGKLHYNYDYVQLPLKFGVSLGNRLSFLANIGLVPSINVISKMKVPTDIEGQSEKDIKDKVQSFDFSGLAEIGAALKFAKRFMAFLAVSYQHSLTDFNKDEYFVDMKLKHYCITAAGGIKFALKK
jgi:hypothetical protein